ncbi:variant erythrocyte surface antigen-1 family protein [Babesia caballi]|uniref:Variant erythrocyte surface antigen-1 family protein n=1 Tax=Babesia caballi TaxID=5871 RepID=A0AAV4LQD8_BABCB|nr:variant erythrocyte surface antigen-1 family protein [Babesia caballi]
MSLADCPSNLKEAIDWILRVTGKDGQGSDNTRDLATAVKEILGKAVEEVDGMISNRHKNGAELSQLKDGLTRAVTWVEKDVEGGLFGSPMAWRGLLVIKNISGSFFGKDEWKVTGAGIAPSNMATHRLCDATIAFTIGVLEGCKKKVTGDHKSKLDGVITKLHEKYGAGPDGLKDVATKVQSGLTGSWGQVNQFVVDLQTAFQTNITGLSDDAEIVASKVGEYLKGVFNGKSKWGDADQVTNKLTTLIKDQYAVKDKTYDPNGRGVGSKINAVSGALKPNAVVQSILNAGKKAFMDQLKKKNYTSFYDNKTNRKTDWNQISGDTANVQKCAKLFLGCLPFIFNNLSYFYWQCRDGGAWRNHNLTGGALSAFMQGHWFFNSNMNENMTGTSVVKNVMNARFPELQTAASATQHKSYSDFLKNFRSKGLETWQQSHPQPSTSNYLSGLYTLCSCYFQCQQIKSAEKASRTPQTIREMLYFLGALQFSPQYEAFDRYVTGHFKTLLGKQSEDSTDDFDLKLQVADSGTSATGNTLSAADLKSHLLSTAIFIPGALGVMQGPAATENTSEPWLFELFCNSAFQFKYDSGASLFSRISNYAYALQFQVLFLYLMCNTYVEKCGWNNCTYGREVKPNGSGETLASHICPGLKCGGDSSCGHKKGGNNCKHNIYDQTGGCGKGSNNSPLQAFLTDGIQGMCRQHPGTSHHLADCSGVLCHVPMGFKAKHLRQDTRTGNLISLALQSFCGTSSSPLRQLSEKLGCLTKRTPRTLGDLFGFIWHLNGQLFNQKFHEPLRAALQKSTTQTLSTLLTSLKALQPSSLLSNSIAKLAEVSFWNTPDSYGLASLLATNLFSLNQHCHKKEKDGKITHNTGGCTTSPNDLWSLYQPVRSTGNNNSDCAKKSCGGYLLPLTHSEGATYAPVHASVYLSWLTYLTDDFHEWFQNLLDEFKNIDCSKTGCKRKNGGICHCPKGQHGSASPQCNCDSVVHCGGVLPVLYRHGFQFYSPHSLSGAISAPAKRSCQKFNDQLTAVLAEGAPLTNLLTTIDDFLYMFRFYFCYNLSTFWIMYVCVILYTLFFLLDTLHVRSHLKLTASHVVPPLALLTAAKPLPITKLTYYLP